MVTRGQVWEYVVGSRQHRILIISGDEVNECDELPPWGLAVMSPAVGLFTVPCNGGHVHIPLIHRIDRAGLRNTVGMVSGATMKEIETTLRDFLDLP